MTITVGDVLSNALPDSGWGQFDLYVFRDADLILYVGKTNQNVIDRIAQHLGLTYFADSQVGRLIEDNSPASHAWSIDLDHAERSLILEHSPALNVIANPQPRALPRKYTRRKEARMRAAFKKAFGGKK